MAVGRTTPRLVLASRAAIFVYRFCPAPAWPVPPAGDVPPVVDWPVLELLVVCPVPLASAARSLTYAAPGSWNIQLSSRPCLFGPLASRVTSIRTEVGSVVVSDQVSVQP